MHLKSIKLAGFKSFVDLTTIPIRSYMNAIVGPNGCGKSNVVDAIRWVIGETSAKQLRGQSMTDVIFNGTTQRKPVGKAAVELTFDNSDARIVGEFANYNEIAIRREVEREGQSSYYINGTHCRRKDIIDLFLGTGLGPRSYAIIEQGMVSQLIEAKPDDIRVYLEEAAGISKYKERRRETENRIKRTNENLERLHDLSEELIKQQRHLKRQANAAERYKEYKEQERLLQAQIKALQWQALDQKTKAFDDEVTAKQLQLEKTQTELQTVETELEKGRVAQTELSETLNQAQKDFYGLGAQIARIEQEIKYTNDQKTQWTNELGQINENWQELSDSTLTHQDQIQQLSKTVNQLAPQQETIQNQAVRAKQELAMADDQMLQWERSYERYQNELAHTRQKLEVTKTKAEHCKKQLMQLENRLQAIIQDIDDRKIEQLTTEIEPLAENLRQLEFDSAKINSEREQITENIATTRNHITGVKAELQQTQNILREKETQYTRLNALQQSALEADDQQTIEWLNRFNLAENPRLGKSLQANAGWELAVETVLSHYIDAICVDNIEAYLDGCQELAKGAITIIDQSSTADYSAFNKAPTLASKIQSDWPVDAWLQGIYIVENLTQAKELRSQLNSNESVITQDGIWLGKNWIRIAKATADEGSVLLREKTIKTLEQAIADLSHTLQGQTDTLQQYETTFTQLETNRETAHQNYQQLTSQLTQAQKALSTKQSQLQQLQQTQQRLIQERLQVEGEQQTLTQQMGQLNTEMQHCETELQEQTEITHKMQFEREQQRKELEQTRDKATHDQQRADEFEIRLSSNESQLQLLQQTMSHTERQMHQLEKRRQGLQQQLVDSQDPLQEAEQLLQAQLEKRVGVQQQLTEAEQKLNQHQHHMKALDDNRHQMSQSIQGQQTQLQNAQMEKQAITVRQATITESLAETDYQLQQLIEEMPEEAQLKPWEDRAMQLAQKITRLGPINLAAIDEYQVVSERKDYLDKQQADLNEALEVLQEAIKKIDRETRLKFKETFDKVNNKFKEVFPRIFGGGSASLEMLDDDILSTGILVRAQPPGKRNSTIHMLSGGEKALTALSLIFGVFHLNPAPFCVLDEVDAPLDDANVGRFCTLVKEMSQTTQFIIISHNKVTISSADQLMGVTMQEAGVSRIVSVDVEKAMAMVEA